MYGLLENLLDSDKWSSVILHAATIPAMLGFAILMTVYKANVSNYTHLYIVSLQTKYQTLMK